MRKQNYRFIFILADIFASGIAWSLFYIFRKSFIETAKFGYHVPFQSDLKFFASLLLIPCFWFLLYYSSGAYNDIRRQTQVRNLLNLFTSTFSGVFIIFFSLILDDTVISYRNYYQSFLVLLLLQFFVTLFFRSVILFYKNWQFRNGKDKFTVIVIGESDRILRFYNDNNNWLQINHFEIAGYILNGEVLKDKLLEKPVSSMSSINNFINETHAEEIFIITEVKDKNEVDNILLKLFRKDVYIRILPELYLFVKMPVKIYDIFNEPLLLLSKDILRAWQSGIKTLLDVILSLTAIVLLSPLIIILVVAIKISSPGPILYSQERVGKNGRLFRILKFRSMYLNSELQGPMLATRNDKRITWVGKLMRKRRLDEIPNFINVLRGEMSLVGPRPERIFYIEQILDKDPQYAKLHLVKPGITSWGQVKFGYAENVEAMIQRMHHDLVYIENMSLFADLQILFKTIGIIFKGHGI